MFKPGWMDEPLGFLAGNRMPTNIGAMLLRKTFRIWTLEFDMEFFSFRPI